MRWFKPRYLLHGHIHLYRRDVVVQTRYCRDRGDQHLPLPDFGFGDGPRIGCRRHGVTPTLYGETTCKKGAARLAAGLPGASRATSREPGRRKVWKVSSNKAIPFSHRWEHVQAVVSLALWLARQTGADTEVVEAAAWLHDIRKGTAGHGAAGEREARRILQQTNFPPEKLPLVVDAIGHHGDCTVPPTRRS